MKTYPAVFATLLYVVAGSLWIVGSDWVASEIIAVGGAVTVERVQLLKGLLYIGLSGILVFMLVRAATRESRRSSDHLNLLVAERTRELGEAGDALRARNRELSLINRDLRAFSYSVSHDLRAPVRAISGFASIIRRRHGAALPEQAAHYIDNVLTAASRMERLIDDLLRYAQLGSTAVALSPIPVQPTLTAIGRLYSRAVSDVGGSLEVTDRDAVVMADATLLSQVLTNLVQNAVRYRSPDRALHIRIDVTVGSDRDGAAEGGAEQMRVSVVDNGIGIAAEHHERIFNVFQRLQVDDELDHDETGIGLAVARRAAEKMGGSLTVDSSPGSGSTFVLTLQGVRR